MRTIQLALTLLLAAAVAACSFSHSSDSSSDSSEHSSDSSTSSSESSTSDGDGDHDAKPKETARFEHDVEQYTAAFLEAGGRSDESFFAGLGDLARSHGVSDWESDPSAWEAIGRGIARSPATSAQRVAYQSAWTQGDATKQAAVKKGLATAQ
jgi:hypothetical protein